jgi:antitoxin ParD1/3/4
MLQRENPAARTKAMNISLTPELEQFVTQKVESGLYQTASEVIRDGLRLLRERDDLHRQKLEALREEIAVGIEQADQGRVAPFNALETLVRTRKKRQERSQKKS